ncbi:MarR family winged helix-turn-helix transcriptional regulator [Plantactinospora siamensis]|uniref:MarR family winged helix-turn-helix transcriptional regulator n=1 Tax=Plantactinospora siamensis TaxID=555372 RepID=A0ABV6P095_9ACTN
MDVRDQKPAPAANAAARDLVVLFRRLRGRMRDISTNGLTPSQASVLLRLDKDGASSTTLLATAEGVRPQSMTATLNGLRERGLIERHPDPEDGRRTVITLSEAGRAQVGDDRRGRRDWLAQTLEERLTPEQLALVNTALALVSEAIE